MSSQRLAEVLEALAAAGLDEAEVYAKRGRSRRLEYGAGGAAAGFHHEQGWAVRAGDRRGSFFAAGTGEPPPGGPWPAPDGRPLRLADPRPAPPWLEPSELSAPLIGETEGLRLLESLERALAAEVAGARLVAAVLEDGSSEWEVASRRGVAARHRQRLAALRVEAAAPGAGGRPVTAGLYLAAREARRFDLPALARRLADGLVVAAAEGAGPERDRGEVVAAPAVAVRLLAGLLPLLVGPEATARMTALRDRRGRVGGDELTVIDDGRLAGAPLEAPWDGEGLPTRETVIVDGGAFRQPLLAWHQARAAGERAAGCARRSSWRDLPRPGPTHLFVRPRSAVRPAELLESVARGYYLLEATGPGRFDLDDDRFELPVRGFAVQGGRATAPVSSALLAGGVGALLRGVAGVARDLTFFPLDGMIGSPSLLLAGLELRRG